MLEDVVVTKHRVSAFAGTDLDMILRANHIETLVLAGIATSGVVLSTVRHAADADYRIIIVEDCCADRDPEVHRVLTEKVFARQTTVVKAQAALAALATAPAP
jgi:nicotinamidase-related amidase